MKDGSMTSESDIADGWETSAKAWIATIGERGDFAREFILDPSMFRRIRAGTYHQALDVGCGEGRLCRFLHAIGVDAIGLDPAPSLIEHAAKMDPGGDYRIGSAEEMPFDNESFDLVVSCMSLMSMAKPDKAIAEMVRVLRRSGTLLVANLHSVITAGLGLRREGDVGSRFEATSYFARSAKRVTWSRIDVINWHRPLEDYLQAFLREGLALRSFSEPTPVGADPKLAAPFAQIPHFVVMEWLK
jgi:SAM-dependent methyltransferase